MVDSVKGYNIAGIGANVQLGKEVNAQIITNSDHIALLDRDDALNRAAVADGTHQQHAVSKAQLDAVNINRVYSNIVTYSDGVTNMFVIPANTTVLSVSVESIGNWLNTGANTNITVGDAADPDRLFAEFDPTVATKDETNYRYDQQTTIRSTVTADGATAGSAKILILYAGGKVFEAPQSEIDSSTEINIFFDSSGSMDSTLAPLRIMRSQVLKNALLPFYENDEDAYDENVTISEVPSERVWQQMQTLGTNANVTSVINLVFSDENSPYSATSTYPTNPTTTHDTDIAALRSTISTAETANGSAYYRSVMFQVNTGPNSFTGYKQYLQAVMNGTGNYSGSDGLSDRANVEIRLETDVIAGANATYYANQVINGLNSLGYSLPNVSYD
jgi:hypothetical protein